MSLSQILVLILGGLLVAGLAIRLAQAARQRAGARAGYFAQVLPLLEGGSLRPEPTGFPRLTGRFMGQVVDLRAQPDSLTFRKLPVLWVIVSAPQTLPVAATFDLMARPSGLEPFSGFNTLPYALHPPAALPDWVALHTDTAGATLPAALVPRLAALFADPRVKECLISPKGLRIVLMGEEAERGRYLIFREAEPGLTPLPAERLTPALRALHDLSQILSPEPGMPA